MKGLRESSRCCKVGFDRQVADLGLLEERLKGQEGNCMLHQIGKAPPPRHSIEPFKPAVALLFLNRASKQVWRKVIDTGCAAGIGREKVMTSN